MSAEGQDMSTSAQEQMNGQAVVKLEMQLYCACCKRWKYWGCTACGLVFETLEKAIGHDCVAYWAQYRA